MTALLILTNHRHPRSVPDKSQRSDQARYSHVHPPLGSHDGDAVHATIPPETNTVADGRDTGNIVSHRRIALKLLCLGQDDQL